MASVLRALNPFQHSPETATDVANKKEEEPASEAVPKSGEENANGQAEAGEEEEEYDDEETIDYGLYLYKDDPEAAPVIEYLVGNEAEAIGKEEKDLKSTEEKVSTEKGDEKKEVQEGKENKEKEVPPQEEVNEVPPQKEVKEVPPQKEAKEIPPQKEVKEITPQKEVKEVPPQEVFSQKEVPQKEAPLQKEAPPQEESSKKEAPPIKAEEGEEDDFKPTYLTFPEEGPTVVIFYAPWCPHCQAYKPRFISLAKAFQQRLIHQTLNFLAVSCEAYSDICATYEVESYPLIRGFPEAPGAHDKGTVLNADDEPTVREIQTFFDLDLASISNPLLLYDRELTKKEMKERNKQHAVAGKNAAKVQLEQHEYTRTLFDVYSDAGKSFVSLLKTGVYVSNAPLPEDRVNALSDWIELLQWALPHQWGLRDVLIQHLQEHFVEITQGKKQLISTLQNDQASFWGIHAIPGSQHLSPNTISNPTAELRKYSHGCSHGKPGSGFTCGLWEFFHILTIGVAEQYQYGFLTGHLVGTEDISQTLANFIRKFFACQLCRNNFLKMYDACGFDRCNRLHHEFPTPHSVKELPLWLWETHNAVNQRLIGERALREGRNVTKEEREAALWPTKNMCSKCRSSWRGKWNEDAVYDFLRWRYWPGNEHLKSKFHKDARRISESIFDDGQNWWMAGLLPMLLLSTFGVRYMMWKTKLAHSGRHKKFDC